MGRIELPSVVYKTTTFPLSYIGLLFLFERSSKTSGRSERPKQVL